MDSSDSKYDAIYKGIGLVGGTAEGCAGWCLSFRAPGFVGFDMDDVNCACRYSDGTIPDHSNLADAVGWEGESANGPIVRGNNVPGATCYPVVVSEVILFLHSLSPSTNGLVFIRPLLL